MRLEGLGQLRNSFYYSWWGETDSNWYCGDNWPVYQTQMIDDGDCGTLGGMKIGRENRSTRRKSATVPLCPSQIPHDLTRVRTRAVAVGSQRLTAWAWHGFSIEKSNDLIGNRTGDLPACSIVLQPTMLERAHTKTCMHLYFILNTHSTYFIAQRI
jgi:hypothetical protein